MAATGQELTLAEQEILIARIDEEVVRRYPILCDKSMTEL